MQLLSRVATVMTGLPTEPISNSFRRPTRSITRNAMTVAMRFAAPIATLWRSFDSPLNPAAAKMSFR